MYLYLCLYVLIDAIYTFFRCFLSVYTQYLWPISPIRPISPMQCFYGPLSMDRGPQHVDADRDFLGRAWPLRTVQSVCRCVVYVDRSLNG